MRHQAFLALELFFLGCGALPGCGTPTAAPVPPAPRIAVDPAVPWTGEIRISFSGCASCADCRAAMRQVSRSQSGSDHVVVGRGNLRITYPDPAPIRVAEVANALSSPGVIKGKVERVELRVSGRAEAGSSGPVFVVSGTRQSWPLPEGKDPVPLGKPVVILASLEDWKGAGAHPFLTVRSVEPCRE